MSSLPCKMLMFRLLCANGANRFRLLQLNGGFRFRLLQDIIGRYMYKCISKNHRLSPNQVNNGRKYLRSNQEVKNPMDRQTRENTTTRTKGNTKQTTSKTKNTNSGAPEG